MPIVRRSPTGKRGREDARRHREKQREIIRKQLPDIISEEAIITNRKGRIVRVPIRGIEIPVFRPGHRKKGSGDADGGGSAGVGQGSGNQGDIIGRRPAQGQQPGKAGEEPGVDYIETEVDIEELIEMMFEDLGLPNLQEKEVAELEVVLGFKIRGLRKSGPQALLAKKPTYQEGIKRFFAFLSILESETGKDELTCFSALEQSDGFLDEALRLLADPAFVAIAKDVEPFPIYEQDSFRFLDLQENVEHESNAVIIAMMDVSGSMTTMKKYLARSLLFWIVEFLRRVYDNVEVRFIIHHTQAKVVDEESFFKTGESGGTMCHSAYDLAHSLIESQYPTSRWNVYCFHFSDGEDFSPDLSVKAIRKLIEKDKVNMFGYGEIQQSFGPWKASSVLLPAFEKEFPVTRQKDGKLTVVAGQQSFPFVGVVVEDRADIWPAIREFLKKGRWSA